MSDQDRESWTTAERYIAGRLDRIEAEQKNHGEKIYNINAEVSGLRVRASIFGLFGGIVASLLSLVQKSG